MTTKIAIVAFLLITVQGVLTFFQIKALKNAIADARTYGNVAMGSKKGFLGSGKIFILACDNDGIITKAKEMRGITIFERFKDIDTYNGLDIYDFEEKAISMAKGKVPEDVKKRTPELQAILGLINRFEKEDEEEYEYEEQSEDCPNNIMCNENDTIETRDNLLEDGDTSYEC